MEHASIYRIFRMLEMLGSNVDYTTPELTERLDVCERSTYRYIETLKLAGCTIIKKGKNIHKLVKIPSEGIKLEVISPDCFRMNGKESTPVTPKMTLMAKNLLTEEYPLSARDLTYEDGYWWLKTEVKSMAGVRRFYLGLSDQIEILDSPELVSYLSEHVKKNVTIVFDNWLSKASKSP